MWRVVWPQRDILNNLAHHQISYVNQEMLQPYLRDVNDHLLWIADMVNTFRDTLTSVMDLYMSAVSNRLNIVVNRLTVFTVTVGLLGVVAGFYGMNFVDTWPPFRSAWGVPFTLLLMGSIAVTLLYVLHRLRWY
jgi:magnesium transporter